MQKIRWGILGTGAIAKKFAEGLRHADGAVLAAVGSRAAETARAFAQQTGALKACGSYEALVTDPEIDVVYIATPHPAHAAGVRLALENGKAVLCEKPFTMSTGELAPLAALAREKHLFLMEAMWTRFLPAVVQVRRWLAEGAVGEVRQIKADFGFKAAFDPQSRLFNPMLGGGALLDAGIYPVSFASMVLGEPKTVTGAAQIGATGVDEQFSLVFSYENGTLASLGGAVSTDMVSDALILGTTGKIHVPTFLSARSATLLRDGRPPETAAPEFNGNGYNYEAEEVMRCLRAGLTESAVMPPAESLAVMRALDRARAVFGLRYPGE